MVSRPLDSRMRTTTSTRFFEYYLVRAREPTSFWRENSSTTSFSEIVLVVETSYRMLDAFNIILGYGELLIVFHKITVLF